MALQMASAAHLLLCDNGSVLMIRRQNTGYEDGNFSVVAGHVEPGEAARQAMQREAKEEAGIDIALNDLEFVHIMHRWSQGVARHDFFFRCTQWNGDIHNAEPHKCDAMEWHNPRGLPDNTIPYVRAALQHVGTGRPFSEFGWTDRQLP